MNLVATDWRTLSAAAQIRHLEVEGYVVLPDALGRDALEELRRETRQLPTQTSTYHELQGSATVEPQWQGEAMGELIANPPVIKFLQRVLGPELIFFNGSYRYYEPGAIGVVLHTDGYPYGASIGGYIWTSPVSLRVSYYLDDLD